MAKPNAQLFPHGVLTAIKNATFDATGLTASEVETTNQVFSYAESVIRILGAFGFFDIQRSIAQPETPRPYMIWIKPATLDGATLVESEISVYTPVTSTFIDMTPDVFVTMIISKAMSDVTIFKNASATERGMMTKDHFSKLEGVEANANKYLHPVGNGSKHLPPTIVTDEGKVLVATGVPGEYSFDKLNPAMVKWNDSYHAISKLEYDGLVSLLNSANIDVTGSIELI